MNLRPMDRSQEGVRTIPEEYEFMSVELTLEANSAIPSELRSKVSRLQSVRPPWTYRLSS
jgi:hypothetical protein